MLYPNIQLYCLAIRSMNGVQTSKCSPCVELTACHEATSPKPKYLFPIQSHLFSLIICCLNNMNKNKNVIGNPVAANKNIIETQILNYNMATITFEDQKAADRAFTTRPNDQRVGLHISRSRSTGYVRKNMAGQQLHFNQNSGE